MSTSRYSARLVGVFVLGAVALATVMLLMFGRGQLFSHSSKYVAYFHGSVTGLNVGALVKLQGVSIGRVSDILVQYDMERNRVLTPVIAEIDLGKVRDIRDGQSWRHTLTLPELIQRGLRARLAQQSLVTGQLYVDVNFFPERPVELVGAENLGIPEIPTIPSGREEIEDTLRDTLADFRELPIKETVAATLGAVRRIEGILAQPEAQASVRNLNRTLEDVRGLIAHLDGKIDGLSRGMEGALREGQALAHNLNTRVEPLSGASTQALTSLTATLTHAQGALANVEDLTGDRNSALNGALREVAEAARAVRALADSLERHPEALLYGRKRAEER